jgi:hypothetical protein
MPSKRIAFTLILLVFISGFCFADTFLVTYNSDASLSSNLIVDGTSLPGAGYGTTAAGICLRKKTYSPFFSLLKN